MSFLVLHNLDDCGGDNSVISAGHCGSLAGKIVNNSINCVGQCGSLADALRG